MNRNELLHPNHPNGIYLYETPMIGGIRQYLQIRGQDRRNPVLLFLHGGPGAAMSGITHIVHAGWEEHFTVVNWDQRGAAKTHTANKGRAAEIGKTGTMDDFVRDIDEIIAWLHTVLDFDKLILMGFSWGSAIGAEYAMRHPEHLHCFVSVGQYVHYSTGIRLTCEKLLRLIPEGSADAKKVHKLLADIPENPRWDSHLMRIMRNFNPLCGKYIMKHAKRTPIPEVLRSPFCNLREKWLATVPDSRALARSVQTMIECDYRRGMTFALPVLFVFGEEETVCPPEALDWALVTAPRKQRCVIPNAAHACFFDQPEAFLKVMGEFLKQES